MPVNYVNSEAHTLNLVTNAALKKKIENVTLQAPRQLIQRPSKANGATIKVAAAMNLKKKLEVYKPIRVCFPSG